MPRAVSPHPSGPSSHSGPADRNLRARLHSDSPVLATFVMIPRIEIVEMAAAAGFDALVFDLEHAQMAIEDLPPLHAAARAAGAFSLARISSDREVEVSRALDMGVDGVIVPHVASAAAARRVTAAGRFPPAGERSLNPYARGVGYGRNPAGWANQSTALVAMIEGTGALAAADEIAGVAEIDALFVGPVDLAASLGFPGEPEHPEVIGRIRQLIGRLNDRGVATGIYAPTAQAARRWLAAGVRLVVASADNAMSMDAFAAMNSAIADTSSQRLGGS